MNGAHRDRTGNLRLAKAALTCENAGKTGPSQKTPDSSPNSRPGKSAPDDADLAAIVAAWPKLTAALADALDALPADERPGIVAHVRALAAMTPAKRAAMLTLTSE